MTCPDSPLPSASTSGLLELFWRRFTWRHWCQAPLQSALLVALLSLGVGVFLSIRLANRAAVASFQNFTDLLTAESDGLISAPAGTLPESVLSELRSALGDTPVQIVPVVESTGSRPRTSEDEAIGSRGSFQIVGVDLIALGNLAARQKADRGWFGQEAPRETSSPGRESGVAAQGAMAFWTSFRDPRSVFVSAELARAEGWTLGGEFPLILNETIVNLRIAGLIPADPSRPAVPARMLVMDLPALQHWTGMTGRLSRVEFVLEDGPRRAERWAELRTRLESLAGGVATGLEASGPNPPARWRVSSPADRRAAGEVMTRAFRLNLTILSLLALVVGLYLVFQALDGAVVRRREEIAILRSLGVTPRAIQGAWLAEAAALGVVGGVMGLALGWLGAQGAVRLVGRTVNALYYSTSADRAELLLGEALLAVVLSVVTSLLAGWLPARSAAATPPAQCLGRGHGRTFAGPRWLQNGRAALVLVGVGVGLVWVPPLRLEGGVRVPWAAYVAALCWTLAAGIGGGFALRFLARGLDALGRWVVEARSPGRVVRPNGTPMEGSTFSVSGIWRLALSQVQEPTGRHRLALAGLVCAVAMTAGMAILVGSFDTTMRGWITRTFQADLYVSSDGAQSASTENRISPRTWRQVAAHPAVARAQVIQATRLELPAGETVLVGGDLAFFRDVARPAWREAPERDGVFDPARNAGVALVSEAFSERFQVRRGDRVEVPTPSGNRTLEVAGVFSDYGNERGSLLVDQVHFRAWFGHELASSLILMLHPGRDAESVRAELRGAHPGLAVFTQRHLRSEALRIFRQTFAITYALELIGVAVAVAGLGLTMVSLLWERRAELTTLRALGMERREMAAAAALEGVVTAVSGVAVGLLTSLALGWVLIHRVNYQTFGWTLETDWPWGQLAILAAMVLLSGAVTAWWAGRWGAQLPVEREE
jgi:putative ABC transport system permease protein